MSKPNAALTAALSALSALAVTTAPAVEPGFEVCSDRYPVAPVARILDSTVLLNPLLDAITAEGYGGGAILSRRFVSEEGQADELRVCAVVDERRTLLDLGPARRSLWLPGAELRPRPRAPRSRRTHRSSC